MGTVTNIGVASLRRLTHCFIILLGLRVLICRALYDNTNVETFDSQADFEAKVRRSDSIWVVQYYDETDEQCKESVKAFTDVATVLKGIVKVGAVNASNGYGEALAASAVKAAKKRGQMGSLPLVQIFPPGEKYSPEDYEGPSMDAHSLLSAVLQTTIVPTLAERANRLLPLKHQQATVQDDSTPVRRDDGSGKVFELDSSSFRETVLDSEDLWMVAFVAPWCGHCKKFLPQWDEAASLLFGKGVFLGTIDASSEDGGKELAQQYEVKGFPTIKVFPKGVEKSAANAWTYDNSREPEHIEAAALRAIADYTYQPTELTSTNVWREKCGNTHDSICVLIALPEASESSEASRKRYMLMFKTVAEGFRGSKFRFLWFEGSSQPDLVRELDMESSSFPAVVAYSTENNSYSAMNGSFTSKRMKKFFHSVRLGWQQQTRLKELPSIVTVEHGDGIGQTPIAVE